MSNYFANEQSVIGGLLLISDLSSQSAQKVFSMLKPGAFQDPRNKLIFIALNKLERENVNADLIMLTSRLEQSGELERVGGVSYIAELIQTVPSAANIFNYADLVRQNSIKTMVNTKMQNALAQFNDLDDASVYQKLGFLETEIASIGNRAVSGRANGLKHISEISKQWVSDLDHRIKNPDEEFGTGSGMKSVDDVLGPKQFVPGSLIVVGARPKMGKTAFLTKMTNHYALDLNKAVAAFSLEMPEQQMFERIITQETGVDSANFYKTDDLTEHDFASSVEAVGKLNNSNFYIDDSPNVTITHIKKESRKLSRNKPIGIIAVDYLTLMDAEKADTNSLAYGEITKQLKMLAKELNCLVLLLTQLNRGLEQRADKRPMPSDSRDTGQIEQDCDYWIGLYRESVYNQEINHEQKGFTEVIIRLNRHGPTGTACQNMIGSRFIDCNWMDLVKEKPYSKQGNF